MKNCSRHSLNILIFMFLSYGSFGLFAGAMEADPAAVVLVEELNLRSAATPVRDWENWRPPEKVVVRVTNPEQLDAMQQVAPGVELVAVTSADEALAEIAGADALLGFCSESLLSAGKELRWVQAYWAGVEECVRIDALQSGDIILTNAQHIGSPALAETSIALMMALVRGLDIYYQNQLKGEWIRNIGELQGTFMELSGRTMLVVGLGGIGTQVAKRAHGLGMRVIATRNSRREGPDYVDYVGLAHEVNDLAAQADVVVNTVPLTEQTRGMFDKAFFDRMKPTAFFISVGRGGSTNTDDLIAALENGDIAGAGLDVTDPEPLPEGHPLWSAPRVIITPHTAGRGDRGRERLFIMVRENLRRYVNGEPMLSVVNIERGY